MNKTSDFSQKYNPLIHKTSSLPHNFLRVITTQNLKKKYGHEYDETEAFTPTKPPRRTSQGVQKASKEDVEAELNIFRRREKIKAEFFSAQNPNNKSGVKKEISVPGSPKKINNVIENFKMRAKNILPEIRILGKTGFKVNQSFGFGASHQTIMKKTNKGMMSLLLFKEDKDEEPKVTLNEISDEDDKKKMHEVYEERTPTYFKNPRGSRNLSTSHFSPLLEASMELNKTTTNSPLMRRAVMSRSSGLKSKGSAKKLMI